MKIYIEKHLITIIVILIVLAMSGTVVFALSNKEKKKESTKSAIKEEIKNNYQIKLNGESIINLNIGDKYEELGAKLYNNEIETDLEITIIGEVNIKKGGEYKITYQYEEQKVIRTIIVKDNIAPKIKLKGSKTITLTEGSNYKEYGYTAIDETDGDITKNVKISGSIKKEIGSYTLTYKVKDKAGNEATTSRKVTIIKPKIEKQPEKEVKEKAEEKKETFVNEIIDMSFISNGFKLSGKHNKTITSVYLYNPNIKTINTTSSEEAIPITNKFEFKTTRSGNTYTANINISNLENGTYDVYISGSGIDELVVNKLSNLLRIKRTKIGNKLVTFNYNKNNIQIKIENHAYQYDILIDPGHGPTTGAVNTTHIEREINLEMSNYEKKRYEEHDLKVLMTRTETNPSLGEGDSSWNELSRRSYAMGYYGVVSKIVYSNHHNSSTSKKSMGPEIIVPATLTKNELASEHKIYNAWIGLNTLSETHTRFYTRDYEDGKIYNKLNGQIINITNYYAVIRIPFNLFNVKSVLYEPAFMSNKDNWQWYWNEENWEQMSEAKIKVYVESLGKTYIEPTE